MHKVYTGNLGNRIEIAKLNDMVEPLNSLDGGSNDGAVDASQAPNSELNPTGSR